MSYTYLQERGGVFSVECCSDIPACALSKSSHTAVKSFCKDSATKYCRDSQFGTTCEPLTANRGTDLLTLFAADSRVKTLAHKAPCLEITPELTVSAADCGANTFASLAKYDRVSHSLKTRQTLLFEDSTECFVTLPRWGILLDGELSEQTPPAQITCANVSGLLPTVMASDWKGGTTAIRKDRGDQRLDQWRDYVKCKFGLTYPHPTHSEMRMGWPENWTDLKPLATDNFQQWQHSHGKYFQEINN